MPETSGEKLSAEEKFSILFPNCKWGKLPRFTPFTMPLLAYLEFEIQCNPYDFVKAVKRGEGFARRVEFKVLDRRIMGSVLEKVFPVSGSPQFAEISDLLKDGERLGGLGTKTIVYSEIRLDDTEIGAALALPDPRASYPLKQGEALVAGVIGKRDNMPHALIVYKEGKRPRGQPVDSLVTVTVPRGMRVAEMQI